MMTTATQFLDELERMLPTFARDGYDGPRIVAGGRPVPDIRRPWITRENRHADHWHELFVGQCREELQALVDAVLRLPERHAALEIGLAHGGTHLLWRMLFDRVTSVDMDGATVADFARRAELDQRSSIVVGSSTDPGTVATVQTSCDDVDFLFIDGDHSYETVLADYFHYAPLVKPGGLIGFHDPLSYYDVRQFLEQLGAGAFDGHRHAIEYIDGGLDLGIAYEVVTRESAAAVRAPMLGSRFRKVLFQPRYLSARIAELMAEWGAARVMVHGVGSHTDALFAHTALATANIIGLSDREPRLWGQTRHGHVVYGPQQAVEAERRRRADLVVRVPGRDGARPRRPGARGHRRRQGLSLRTAR